MHCRFVSAENKTKKTNPDPSSPQQQKIKHTKKILYLTVTPLNTHKDTSTAFLVHTSTVFYILDNGLPFRGPGSF